MKIRYVLKEGKIEAEKFGHGMKVFFNGDLAFMISEKEFEKCFRRIKMDFTGVPHYLAQGLKARRASWEKGVVIAHDAKGNISFNDGKRFKPTVDDFQSSDWEFVTKDGEVL